MKITINASSQIYKVTYGYDVGGPEDGPIIRKGEWFTEATSKEDACKKFDAEWCQADPGYYEGCWAKIATPEEISRWEEDKAAEEAMWEEYHRMWGDDFTDDVQSAQAIMAEELQPWVAVYPYDAGGPEDGPIIHADEMIIYALSEDDAMEKAGEGCSYVRPATDEEVREYEMEVEAEEAYYRDHPEARQADEEYWAWLNSQDEDIESAQAITTARIPGKLAKYYEVYTGEVDPDEQDDMLMFLEDNGYSYVDDLIPKDEYYHELAQRGLDIATLVKDPSGKLTVITPSSGHIQDTLSLFKQEGVFTSAVTSASKTKVPAPYSKYYKIYPSGYPYPEEGLESILDDAGLTFISDVVAKPQYEDKLGADGLDLGILAEDEAGNLKVYLLVHDTLEDILPEVERVLDQSKSMRPVKRGMI